MALQAGRGSAVAVDIDQEITAMTGGTLAEARKKGMVFVLMTGAEVGVVAGVTGDAGATLAAVDGFIWGL